jgi:hypothetical protein
MATLERAIEIAAQAHAGMKDKQGEPYILHPIRVMLGVDAGDAQIVAVLHDVIEDTDVTLEDIRAEGFSDAVLEALDLVTHRKDRPYSEYVIGCKRNVLARQVKLSDLRENASLGRILLRQEKFDTDSSRLHRYVLSYRFLTDQISEADYRALMVRFE